MALNVREEPPSYSGADDSQNLLAHDGQTPSPKLNQIPTLEPLPSMAATKPQESSHLSDIKSLQSGSHSFQAPSGTVIQSLNFPSVPEKEPGVRAGSTGSGYAMSVDTDRQDQSVSMEDPDDRTAAEALLGLGKTDSKRPSPARPRTTSGYETPLRYYPMNISHTRSDASHDTAEPLLSLLTSTHPWLGGTISGSMSAYSSTKSHSPRFIQSSADFVERHIGNPMAHTVGSVGKKTGVEGSLRKYLGSKQHEDGHNAIDPEILGDEPSSKRRRISTAQEDVALGVPVQRTLSGNISVDTLPVYDENRSPAYEATEQPELMTPKRPSASRSWSTQLMISTSGLGAALNEASLRSLKYVLGMLRKANVHVRHLMESLKKLLQDFESERSSQKLEEGFNDKVGAIHLEGSSTGENTIAERIRRLNTEIWNTLKAVVDQVSKHTGGALPENASVIVRWQLMSVPRRWQRAQFQAPQPDKNGELQNSDEKEAFSSAQKMIAFAVEGIEMMDQIGGVVNSTIESAEKWLDTMGKKREQHQDTQTALKPEEHSGPETTTREKVDVEMNEPRDGVGYLQTDQENQQREGLLVDASS